MGRPDMPLQLIIPCKPPRAPLAPKGPLGLVRLHVFGQVGRLGKPLAAASHFALERLLARVRAHVHGKRRARGEPLAAPGLGALEGPLARVDAHVLREHHGLGKCRPAHAARKGLVFRVCDQMPVDLLALGEGAPVAIAVGPAANVGGLARANMVIDYMLVKCLC